jgi:hypothetical protein
MLIYGQFGFDGRADVRPYNDLFRVEIGSCHIAIPPGA